MSIPNLSDYIINLNCTDKALLAELKSIIQKSIEYFQTAFLTKETLLEPKCNEILNKGYELLFKINTCLDFLHILDESQTNKYKYEEAMNYSIGLVSFMNSIQELAHGNHDIDIDKALGLSKISNSPMSTDLSELYIKNMEKKRTMADIEKNNILINYINQYILQLFKINLIIKKIVIY